MASVAISWPIGRYGINNVNSSLSQYIYSVADSFAGSVLEEFFWRGMMLWIILQYTQSRIKIVLLLGCLFSLGHSWSVQIDWSGADRLVNAIRYTSVGALLTLLALRYQSIWIPIAFHFGLNIPITLLFDSREKYQILAIAEGPHLAIFTLLTCACLFALGIKNLINRLSRIIRLFSSKCSGNK